MKLIILFLITFNSFAATKFVMRDLRNNSIQGTDTFETKELAIKRLIEISKVKNGWRTGEFTDVVMDSLYSKAFKNYSEDGMENGEVVKYYHPVNWSYDFPPETQDEKDIKIKDARKKVLREKQKTKDLTLKELNELMR